MGETLLVLCAVRSILAGDPSSVLTGADVLIAERLEELRGKRVGLVCNQTSVLSDGRHLADALRGAPGVTLAALFGPEHGIRGDREGSIVDGVDHTTGIPVYSLYGERHAPPPEVLASLDVLLFDLQDVGARFYTYGTTLGHVMSSAAAAGVPVVVLDRPNPIRGVLVEGPARLDSLRSFVGYAPIPVTHGMTMGELAELYNGEGHLDGGVRANLSVVRMRGWNRGMWFDETRLPWVKPSPNMATLRTATVYPGTCLFEGTNLSEGRGTDAPFEMIGAPWVDTTGVLSRLRALHLEGVEFEGVVFTPRQGQTGATPKHGGSACRGIRVRVADRDGYHPVAVGVAMLWAFRAADPDAFRWKESTIDRLAGTPALRVMLDAGTSPGAIAATWAGDVARFRDVRARYLLYR